MKHYKLFIAVFGSLMFSLSSCEDILDKNPVDRYTDAVLWSDINLVKAYLLDTYQGSRIGYSQYMVTGVSDESQIKHKEDYYVRGDMSPENVAPWGVNSYLPGWKEYYANIQKLNKFIENVGRVVEAAPEGSKADLQAQTDVLKGEALFLRAFAYTQLVRIFGGVPILDRESQIDHDFLSIPRSSFEKTIDFIVKDCDDAAALLLPKAEMEMGKANKAAALALKSRVLLFAASDLTADGTAGSALVGYENPDRVALWTAARDAAKAVMDLPGFGLADFGAPDKTLIPQRMAAFFAAKDLASPEVIWGKMYSGIDGEVNQMNQWNEPSGAVGWNSINPSQKLVDSYQMEDGSDFFDHFEIVGNTYQNISGTYPGEDLYEHRDPRFYGTILFDGAPWKGRPYDIRTRVTIQGGVETERVYGYDTENSTFNSHNATITGYAIRKMLDEELTTLTTPYRNQNAWIEFRLAEVLLNYAEASIALGDEPEAAKYINQIRSRAGMPDFSGDITEALRYERQVELAFENHRWYDMRRWKILEQELIDNYGIRIEEVTEDGNTTTTWTRAVFQQREALERMLWVPIPQPERARAPQLEQNPGYNN